MKRIVPLLAVLTLLAMLASVVPAFADTTIEPYLAYNKVRDRVSACNQTGQWNCLADDGFNDAMFVVFLHCTSCGTPARRTVTRITIQRTGGGTWDTDTNSAAWVLGVVAAGSNAQVDAPFLNDSETGKVNFVMQNGAEIYIFASDGRTLNHLTDDYFTEGAEFTVTFGFDDNSTVSKKIVNYHQEEIDLSTNSEGPHAGVRYTLPLSEPTVSLTYDGKLRDRVSQANETRTGDSVKDGTFTLTVDPGNQPAFNMPNITKITLYSSAPGSWDTDDSTPSWTLGVAHSLDGDLLNGSNDNVDITVTVGGPRMVKLFAADWSEIEFVSETDITVTVDLADGSQMQKTITIP